MCRRHQVHLPVTSRYAPGPCWRPLPWMLLIFLGSGLAGGTNTRGKSLGAESALPTIEVDAGLRQRCVSILRQVMAGDEFWPAMHAAEALTLAGFGAEVVQTLEPRLATESDAQKGCGLAREIVRAGKRAPLNRLWTTLADTRSNGRVHAAESLYKIAELQDGPLMRSAMRQTEDPRLELMAAAALARAGSHEGYERLRRSLSSDDRELRKIGAWVLGLLGDADDLPQLRQLLAEETDPLARAYYVNALACLGDGPSIAALGRNLSSPDASIRIYSAEFCGYARVVTERQALVRLLDDAHVDVRARAAQSLLVLAQPEHVLGLPLRSGDAFQVDVYPATADNPRYSEGSVMVLRDNSLLYATTEFIGAGADHATARIVARSSADGGRTWGPQRVLQENIGRQNSMSVTLRRLPPGADEAPLGMFFLVKNGPRDLKAWLRISRDDARTFGEGILITAGDGYHVLNNDRLTLTRGGRLVCPVSFSPDLEKDGHFRCKCFLSDDGGHSWFESPDIIDQPKRGAMEPEVVELADGRLLMIIRTQTGRIATSLSSDGGLHWSAPDALPVDSPESPATIRTVPATGDLLLVWNQSPNQRTPLTAAVSSDEGRTWRHVRQIETDPQHRYAYTSVLFHKDRVLLSYYVQDPATRRISSRFRSLPVRWFYELVPASFRP